MLKIYACALCCCDPSSVLKFPLNGCCFVRLAYMSDNYYCFQNGLCCLSICVKMAILFIWQYGSTCCLLFCKIGPFCLLLMSVYVLACIYMHSVEIHGKLLCHNFIIFKKVKQLFHILYIYCSLTFLVQEIVLNLSC